MQGADGADEAAEVLREKELKPLIAKVESLEEELKSLQKQEQ